MIIHERSITEPYWKAAQDYNQRRLDTGRFHVVDRQGVLHIHGSENRRTYCMRDFEERQVAWLYLGKRPTWQAWEVLHVWVYPHCRGEGYAGKLYDAAINHDKLLVASGKTQSKSSRALWANFIKNKRYYIWAQDFKNLKIAHSIHMDEDDEIDCELELYTRDTSYTRDVRFLALRKRI